MTLLSVAYHFFFSWLRLVVVDWGGGGGAINLLPPCPYPA